jgi:hypothetical protein
MSSQVLQSAETLIIYIYTNCKTVCHCQIQCLKCGDSEEYSLLGRHTAYWNRKLLSSEKPSVYIFTGLLGVTSETQRSSRQYAFLSLYNNNLSTTPFSLRHN